jgi:hypothetical protein
VSRLWLSRLLIALVLLLLAACQVDVEVDLVVAEDGSGTVEVQALFDQEAEQVMGDFANQLRVNDLERAGWTVDIDELDNGAVNVVANKPVANAAQWQNVLDEIAGPGVFNQVRVVAIDEEQRLSFELDLSDGWDLFTDQGVIDALDGEPFGAPIESLTGGRSIDEIVDVDVDVRVRNFNDGVPAVQSF